MPPGWRICRKRRTAAASSWMCSSTLESTMVSSCSSFRASQSASATSDRYGRTCGLPRKQVLQPVHVEAVDLERDQQLARRLQLAR